MRHSTELQLTGDVSKQVRQQLRELQVAIRVDLYPPVLVILAGIELVSGNTE